MKRTIIIILFLIALMPAFAAKGYSYNDSDEIYDRQKSASGADSVYDALPHDIKELLSSLGLNGINKDDISSLQTDRFADAVLKVIKDTFSDEYIPAGMILGIILLCAAADCFKKSDGTGGIFDIAAVTVLSTGIVIPISNMMAAAEKTINDTAAFMTVYIPVMSGLMISSGQPASGSAYYALMMAASQICTFLCSKIIIPAINMFFAISIVSVICPNMSTGTLSDTLNKAIKWVLGFAMSIFASLFTLQGIVSGYSDNLSSKAVKFAVKSFVPVVGNALSDVYSSVMLSVKLLKSGVGIVAVTGAGFLFLPAFFKCLFWIVTLTLCKLCAELFDLGSITRLLDVCSKALSCFIAVLLSVMALFIISAAVMLLSGGM